MEILPSLSSFTTLLLSFCAIKIPPSLVAMMPSALLPSTCQASFHCWPGAMTPAIPMIVTACGLAAGAGPFACPPLAAPPLAWPPLPTGGGTLQVFSSSGCLGSLGACTPGPDFWAAGGAWQKAADAPSAPITIITILVDLIKASCGSNRDARVPEYQYRADRGISMPDQPSYCSTFKPAFQSVTYTIPSVVTRMSADLAASATLGRGSISFLGVGGTQYAISFGENASLISKTRTPAT